MDKVYCGFCGKDNKSVTRMLAGIGDHHICNTCVELSSQVLKNESKKSNDKERKKRFRDTFTTITPKEIVHELDKHVIGQSSAKKNVSVAIYNHCKRILHETEIKIQKSNVLLIGPTGVGKTLIAESLADILGVPFVITDSTVITESGYAGEDVSVLIQKLYQASDYDLAKTEIGIIYVDEIDKKAKRNDMMSLSRDVSGEGVQQSLLKLMEGTRVTVPNKPGTVPENVEIDTTNILFIVGGAFVGLDETVKQRIGNKRIGFGKSKTVHGNDWTKYLVTGDLVKYGLIPEFCGRLPSVSVLHDLSRDDLVRVLSEPKNSIVNQYKALFSLDKINLEFTMEALELIANTAIEQELGARGLRKILDEIMLDICYELPEMKEQGIKSVLINDMVITGSGKPLCIKGSSN